MPIITIQSFKEIQLTSEQTANALVVIDIDQTTIDVKKRRIMSDSNKVQRLAFTDSLKGLKTVSGRDPVSIVYSDEGNSYDLVEDGFDKFVADLQARCAHVVALTSRRTGKPPNASEPAQDNLIRKLKALGIDFSKSSPSEHLGVVRLDNQMALVGTESGPKTMDDFEVNGGPQCYEGIVFTAVGEKGVAIGTYSQNINYFPDIIIAIDDTRSKLESLQQYCDENGILFIGFEYHAARLVAEALPLDEKVVALQRQIILDEDRFMSDAETKLRLERMVRDEPKRKEETQTQPMGVSVSRIDFSIRHEGFFDPRNDSEASCTLVMEDENGTQPDGRPGF